MPIDYETLFHEPARRMDEERKPMTPTPEMESFALEVALKHFGTCSGLMIRIMSAAIMEVRKKAIKRDREKLLNVGAIGFDQCPMESWDDEGNLVLYWNSEDGIVSASLDGSGHAIVFSEINGSQMLDDAWPVTKASCI